VPPPHPVRARTSATDRARLEKRMEARIRGR
jgi:hypothetical protein